MDVHIYPYPFAEADPIVARDPLHSVVSLPINGDGKKGTVTTIVSLAGHALDELYAAMK